MLDREDGGGDLSASVDGDYVPAKRVAPAGWPAIRWPAENPYTPEKDILGRRLFFDRRLSRTEDRACAWCHAPEAGFADPRHPSVSGGVGDGIIARNAPVSANMAFARAFFLDGRDRTTMRSALFAPDRRRSQAFRIPFFVSVADP